MGITRTEQLFRIRDLLDTPNVQHPSFHSLFRQELSEEADILNATSNAQRPWAVSTYTLNYTPGQSSYQINCTDLGKPILVTRVIYSPYIKRLNVQFSDFNGQIYGTVFQAFNSLYGMPWNIEDAPEQMSFFRSGVLNSSYQVAIQPQLQQSAVYEISYIPGYIGVDDPLEAAIQLPEQGELVRLRAAMAQLPYAQWTDDPEKDRQKRGDLAQAFSYQLERKEKIFQRYISSITTPRDTMVADWNSYD